MSSARATRTARSELPETRASHEAFAVPRPLISPVLANDNPRTQYTSIVLIVTARGHLAKYRSTGRGSGTGRFVDRPPASSLTISSLPGSIDSVMLMFDSV